jgi:hypothetical protein
LDITTLTQASRTGAAVCTLADSYMESVILQTFPDINIVPCTGGNDGADDECMQMLKNEDCFLSVSDELVLRKEQADDPSLEMTGEALNQQLLAWPYRKDLDPTISFYLNKWMYAAISNQTISELYFEYFEKKLCTIGTAGKDCELSCDPDHGMANAAGACVCESTRWTGDDCSKEVPENMNHLPSTVIIIAYVMFALNALVIVICGVWLYWQRNSCQVRVSQPFFLLLVLLGCLINSSTILTMAQDDSGEDDPVLACMAMPWLYSVGFSVTFGTLFAKIRRVYKLFTAPVVCGNIAGSTSGRKNSVTVQETLFFIGAVLVLDMIILVLWTVIDPLEWQRTPVQEDQFGDPLESQGQCTSDTWKIFASIIGILHFGLLAVACYMCYVARNIPTKYSEHKYVTIAMISNLQIFVVGGENIFEGMRTHHEDIRCSYNSQYMSHFYLIVQYRF